MKYFNPIFLWKKRNSIKNRLKELPSDYMWKMAFSFIDKGYISNVDYKKISDLKDTHAGKTGYLIGNGPSVQIEDLEQLTEHVIFACNRIYLAFDDTKFRPSYLLSADEQMIEDFGEEMIAHAEQVFFTAKLKPKVKGEFTWFRMRNGRPFVFSKNAQREIMTGGGTLITAIQIGYWMGIREFYLYGVDHSFKFEKKHGEIKNAEGDGNHFIKGYRSGKKWQAPVIDLVEEAFYKCDQVMRAEGGFLKNATRGGKLEILERIEFDEII